MKIGFIDYFLSEWHANNYPAWIKRCSEKLGIAAEVKYAYAELNKSPYDNVTTDEWCSKYNTEKCQTIEELCEKSDCVIILSPDNPEKHLKYAKKAFPFGKNTYVDKTFAPNLDESKQIFALAEKYNTKFFTASALGFANELSDFNDIKSIITTGGGGNLETYIIHQLEMIVKIMGTGALRTISLNDGNNATVGIEYANKRTGVINFSNGYNFSISVEKDGENSVYKPITSDYFINLIEAILLFFNGGKAAFEKEHTLEVMALRDACLQSQNKIGEYIEVKR